MLHIESPRRFLVVAAILAALALVIYLLASSGTSTSGSGGASEVAQKILAATSAQPHVQLEEQAGTSTSVSLRLIDRTADENAFESGGVLLYMQTGAQLYTRGQRCYYQTTLNGSPAPLTFVGELLPPAGAKPIYSQPAPDELTWTLPPTLQGKTLSKTKPTQGKVLFDPKTYLLQSASITVSQITERTSITYPAALSFPAIPTSICRHSSLVRARK